MITSNAASVAIETRVEGQGGNLPLLRLRAEYQADEGILAPLRRQATTACTEKKSCQRTSLITTVLEGLSHQR